MICINYDHNKKFELLQFHSGYSRKIINAQTAVGNVIYSEWIT